MATWPKIKNFRNTIFHILFDPKIYTDHILRKNYLLEIITSNLVVWIAINDKFDEC